MKLHMNLADRSYDIIIERGVLQKADTVLNFNRRVMVVTESGVPDHYAKTVLSLCKQGFLTVLDGGEDGKNLSQVEKVLLAMKNADFERGDCVVAVGGGVIGDLAGFAASMYMRGVDFYNIPTTLLSQIDSSIGGKTGVNFDGVKNLIGAFHQPRAVLIDPELLKTLPQRQLANGMAEAIKMAMTFDRELIEKMEREDPFSMIDDVIVRSLQIKKSVVEQDEKEAGLRRVLNFGHTVGHGIEGLGQGLYHGECVALGMLVMSAKGVRERLKALLSRVGLPSEYHGDTEQVMSLLLHDKKSTKGGVAAVCVDQIGSFVIREMTADQILGAIKETFSI